MITNGVASEYEIPRGLSGIEIDRVKKAYQQGREDAIDECIEKLYEVTPQTVDEKLDMVFVNALRELKEQENEL